MSSKPANPPRHEGCWAAASAMLAGAPFPDEVTKSIPLILTAGRYEVSVGGQPDRGGYETDMARSPHRMQIVGKAYPTAFESTAENGWFLVEYTRKEV